MLCKYLALTTTVVSFLLGINYIECYRSSINVGLTCYGIFDHYGATKMGIMVSEINGH